MANKQLEEVIEGLKDLRAHYEDQLNLIGLELSDFPDDVLALLDQCVELQTVTNLHDLDENYLQEYYYTKKKEQLDNNLIIAKLENEIKEQQSQLENEATECATLEKSIESAKNRAISTSELEHLRDVLETKVKDLQEKEKAFKIPQDFDIDTLIRKVELLQKKKTEK